MPLTDSFERYLQDKGKGRGGDGGNYRRNVARELERFADWTAGNTGADSWDGIIPNDTDREPIFNDLDERTFREYARHLSGNRGLKQNTVQTYYRYISAWCGWCVNEGYLEAHYAQRASATAPLPEDDGRKPGDQQAWNSDQRHALTRYVDEQAREAITAYTELPSDTDPLTKQRSRYKALKTTRDRVLVYVLAYTGVRVGELLRDPNDPRRRGVRWEEISIEDGSMDVYRKKQQWDAASLPDPVIPPLRSYRKLMDPPTNRWPVFPTFDQRTLATVVQEALAERGLQSDEIDERREDYARDLLLALDEDIRPASITTDGARTVLKRLSEVGAIES
jgi:integrase